MNSKTQSRMIKGAVAAVLAVGAASAVAHHSFALYEMEKTVSFTGVVTRVNPDANHLQIFFAPMNAERKNVERDSEGKPVVWAVEMTGSAQAAADGISVSTFPPGTIFSVGMHPLRSGEHAGARVNPGAIYKCPEKKPPAPGKGCDSVEGSQMIGGGQLPIGTAPGQQPPAKK